MQRYFAKNRELELLESDIHHIKRVMRMKKGDKIEVVFDKLVYVCEIKSIDPLSFDVIDEKRENNELDIDLVVAIGLVKEQKMDLILQKLTELGVKEIIPLKMERSIVKLDDVRYKKKKERWEMICKEASEQSHRNVIPKIGSMMSLKELINIDSNIKLVASVKESENFINKYLQKMNKCVKMIIVIGPEGGISSSEEDFLVANGYESVSLGKLVLRVETAAIYVASVVSYSCMR